MTKAEERALGAEALSAFTGVKLEHIKRQLTVLLGLIGRDGIFDEYTAHDISHTEKMLLMLEWLVPDSTKDIMSPADWLLTVLAIYFHDLGMLVTKHEFKLRQTSAFPSFKQNVLFAGTEGADYKAKVAELPPEDAERFLYQEFVRYKHAERIRAWIVGKPAEHLGIANPAIEEVEKLLAPLSQLFRRDLSLICESHHLNDLDDLKKYRVSQPYGNTPEETANVHYAAVLLRTADLLHITGDRTPSTAFRLIDPADPISQQEWAKQMAVTSVRSKPAVDREGNPNDNLPRDTIEVYAYFTKEDGFFALTSYLKYAADQITRSYEWSLLANKKGGARHVFPWRFIDDSHIETEGFLRSTFHFSIDEAKILDLLTGHTLYNDTTVVIRELAQNSIDAVRLQYLLDQQNGVDAKPGSVSIHWDNRERSLTVIDNGTGMTQQVIEKHLLKVGSSRYQDPDFTKEFPTFSPISRFGIGVLTAFMVADMVELVTCHPSEEHARRLSLRSVHGRYLIRLVEKTADPLGRQVLPHGTVIKLRLRPSAATPYVIAIARRWIVIPECNVTARIDEQPTVPIGFDSPADALKGIVSDIEKIYGQQGLKIEEFQVGNLTVAIALQWSDYFQEWAFLRHPLALARNPEQREEPPDFGICVEGIRVSFSTPGFEQKNLVAIANARGPTAPKTNVARSGLETTPQRDETISAIYGVYCAHVVSQIRSLENEFSLTWATQEASYLLAPLLTGNKVTPVDPAALRAKAAEVPVLVVEEAGQRRSMSPLGIRQQNSFWLIDSRLHRSAELLLRDIRGPVSISSLIKSVSPDQANLPQGIILSESSVGSMLSEIVFSGKEVQAIHIHAKERRVDLKWATSAGAWITARDHLEEEMIHLRAF